jgi:hypothetical protein
MRRTPALPLSSADIFSRGSVRLPVRQLRNCRETSPLLQADAVISQVVDYCLVETISSTAYLNFPEIEFSATTPSRIAPTDELAETTNLRAIRQILEGRKSPACTGSSSQIFDLISATSASRVTAAVVVECRLDSNSIQEPPKVRMMPVGGPHVATAWESIPQIAIVIETVLWGAR